MALGREQLKSELIEQVLERIGERLQGTRAAQAARFVRTFYSHVAPEDLLGESVDSLYGAALALWGFAQERSREAHKLRVYDPRFESHGWESSHTILEIVNDDMPFLVDSVVAAVQGIGAEVYLIIHPLLHVRRNEDGVFEELYERSQELENGEELGDDVQVESVMQIQISAQPADLREELEKRVAAVLGDVRSAVNDWRTMNRRCEQLIEDLRRDPPPLPEEEIAEGTAFLEWLNDDHFTFIGYREYAFEGEDQQAVARVIPGHGLGLLADDEVTVFAEDRSLAPMPDHVRSFLRRPELLVISKAARRSTVHRPVHLDAIGVKMLNDSGDVVGQRLFVGLFTSVAYADRPAEIPLLRRKVTRTLTKSELPSDSHAGKALAHILDNYPRDELFQITEEDLFEIAIGVLQIQERQRIAFFPRRDAFERFISCLVYVPRDRFDTALRLKFQELLAAAYEGEVSDFYTHLTNSRLARLHVVVATTPGQIPEVDAAMLEQRLADAGRQWSDRLQEALIEARGEEQGLAAMHRFGNAFPSSYEDRFHAHTAVADIAGVEESLATGLALHHYRPIEAEEQELRLKIYFCNERVPLSVVLPRLENMGLQVLDEIPYKVRPAEDENMVFIRVFVMRVEGQLRVDLAAVRDAFHEAFRLIWRGEMENDGFNRLVLLAGLTAREVTILRALCKFLLQARIPFSQAYMEETLAKNPEISRNLVRQFLIRFDPETREDRSAALKVLKDELEERLEQVSQLDEDRIIRRFNNLIRATLRTNFFQRDATGGQKPWISFKFNSTKIRRLPKPRPFREIFVYSPRVEAVHLRGGPVARGGIRWSDRREDFRTEVLGLMKAQMVKNAVIIPVGSKGGFVVKNPPQGDRQELMAEVVACYQTMMRGILDITDNLEASEVVSPAQVVRRDGDDPYLVVAADKGTATFSDIANGISSEYEFWLGDAFASGGSAGYDHKKMAITARGAWESVKRHFRELGEGKDIQKEDFTVVGVGDMSGDVFGNGMLLSRHIRLLAAFNHLHIFVDPDPDPEVSWQERKRLFDLPRSTWADYNPALLSAGGGVFERSAKSIDLTPQIRQLLGLEKETISPSRLIRALLTAEVELLWFGGIGTYVKSSVETQPMAGDRANDVLRVDGRELRARVVGEGANLAMTQRARVEYAQNGGRLNTDAIDNSAGVDCSDHEVNIKILLRGVEAAGDLTRKQRDELLREMTDEVAELVLQDNYLQTQAITVTHRLGAHLLDRTGRFVRALERAGSLDRKIEFLPDDETLAERMQQGQGFTRPEISVMLSHAKMDLYAALLSSDLPEDPYMQSELVRYFPVPLRERFPEQIAGHRLSREIIATVVTNSIVNRVGITFVHEVKERTGMLAGDIARAYIISREVFRLRPLWSLIEGLDNRVPAAVQASMLTDCGRLIERGTVWFLREGLKPLEILPQIEAYAQGIHEVAENLEALLPVANRKAVWERSHAYVEEGVPEGVALLAAKLMLLAPCCDIVRIGRDLKVGVEDVARIYFAIGSRLGIDWLRRAASQLPTDSAWDKLAVTAIVDDLYGHQSELTRRVIEAAAGEESGKAAIATWSEGRRSQVHQTEQLLAELQSVANPNLSMLAVANRQLKSMST